MSQKDIILTVTGSDGSGGSGIQADTHFISQLGGVVASVITSITVQNTLGIQEFYDLPAEVVRRQMEAIINDLQPQVVKIGLLRRIDVVEAVSEVLHRYRPRHIIYAPVFTSSRGDQLISSEIYATIRQRLLPLCSVVLEPSMLPQTKKRLHGHANQFSSALAVFLSRGECVEEAMLHARSFLNELPVGYVENRNRSSELYNRFLDAVERFWGRYSDVAFYAEQLNVSPRYLGQVTRRVANRSPKAIIDERLTNEICTLLRTTSKPLKEIAYQLGFSSQAHLSRYFKKQRGISPSAYKLGASAPIYTE